LHRIRAITLDLDNTLWDIDPVIHRAEAALWLWLGENYPRIPDAFSAEDVKVLREVIVEKYWKHKRHDFRFLRKKVLEMLAQEAGYDSDLVEPAFKVFDDARNDVELYSDVLPDLEHLFERFTVVTLLLRRRLALPSPRAVFSISQSTRQVLRRKRFCTSATIRKPT
jgi:putative hydrolase of the HAD superfamily